MTAVKRRPKNRLQDLNGFTLLEIMISLAILSIIFTLIYGTFTNVYRGNEQIEEEADGYRLARLGIHYLANDLSMVYISLTASMPGSTQTPVLVFKGEDSERLDGTTTFSNDALRFSTVSHRRSGLNAPESDRIIVRYSLQDNILIQEARLSNGRVLINELGGPINGLNFRYFDRKGNRWLTSWDADEKDQKPPLAVEIEFTLQKEGAEARRFRTWVDIPMGLRS